MNKPDAIEKIQAGDQEIVDDVGSYTSTDSGGETKGHTLQRGLKARHIQMIALGGTIGKIDKFDYHQYMIC
jgi:lysine-specific permease